MPPIRTKLASWIPRGLVIFSRAAVRHRRQVRDATHSNHAPTTRAPVHTLHSMTDIGLPPSAIRSILIGTYPLVC